MRLMQLLMRPVLLPLNMRSSERTFHCDGFFLSGMIYVIADSFINLHHPHPHTFTHHFSRMHSFQSLTLTSFVAQLMSTLTILRSCFLEGIYCLIVTLLP